MGQEFHFSATKQQEHSSEPCRRPASSPAHCRPLTAAAGAAAAGEAQNTGEASSGDPVSKVSFSLELQAQFYH